ncbi:MAG: DinB family protein [Chloroflexota bacterium]
METHRKRWNEQQKALRQALETAQPEAKALFFSQHAMLHATEVSSTGMASFDEELWQGLDDETARRIPRNETHSIAWCLWHLARIEDVTMNLILAGSDQLFECDGWSTHLKVDLRDTGNAMTPGEIATLSNAVDLAALRAYRSAVGRRTRQIVGQLPQNDFKQKVDPAHLQRVLDEGAVCEASKGLLDYWGNLTFAGLLLMPPTRHNLVHLNEAIRLKKKG